MMKKIGIIVSGKVQGVGFRMSTLQKARQIGVGGYVQNLTNGDVKIVVFGEAQKVDALLLWAESGPPSAIVNNLEVEVMAGDGEEFKGFEIRR
jgi:acylphosphatase